jgi:DNA integrity scanning protein DisA with diadenylate cyclase activity
MKNKIKEYKNFNLPNKFTPLEQYFYYLKELNIIPKDLAVKKIEEIFITLSNDFMEDFLTLDNYLFMIEKLHFDYAVQHLIGINDEIEHLIDELIDNDDITENELKNKLKTVIKSSYIV